MSMSTLRTKYESLKRKVRKMERKVKIFEKEAARDKKSTPICLDVIGQWRLLPGSLEYLENCQRFHAEQRVRFRQLLFSEVDEEERLADYSVENGFIFSVNSVMEGTVGEQSENYGHRVWTTEHVFEDGVVGEVAKAMKGKMLTITVRDDEDECVFILERVVDNEEEDESEAEEEDSDSDFDYDVTLSSEEGSSADSEEEEEEESEDETQSEDVVEEVVRISKVLMSKYTEDFDFSGLLEKCKGMKALADEEFEILKTVNRGFDFVKMDMASEAASTSSEADNSKSETSEAKSLKTASSELTTSSSAASEVASTSSPDSETPEAPKAPEDIPNIQQNPKNKSLTEQTIELAICFTFAILWAVCSIFIGKMFTG